MARRRGLVSSFIRLTEDAARQARRAARQRELETRRARASSERQARTLERLARKQEREEAQAQAAEEHAENEQLLAELRDLLQLVPRRLRSRLDHEKGLVEAPFPPLERASADRARLEAEVAARAAALRPPTPARIALAGIAAVLGSLAGVALAFLHPAVGAALLVASLVALGLSRLWLSKAREEFRRRETARAREEISHRLASELARDAAEHREAESRRVAALRSVLDGDPKASAEAFVCAVEHLDLPLGASAALEMLDAGAAQLDIDLHREDEIPAQRSTLLKTGRISYRNRPQKELREDDARSVASLVLLFAAVACDELPAVETLLVSAYRSGVDPATGHDSDFCFASVAIDRDEVFALKFERLDPVVALRAFEGRFSCSAGFQLKPVEPLTPEDLVEAPQAGGAAAESTARPLAAAGARRAASAPATRAMPAASRPPADPSVEIAQHILELAMACGRADGTLDPAESEAVSDLIAEHYPVSKAAQKRLALEQASLAEAAIGIDAPAAALKRLLAPRDRQLVLERIVSVAAADGKVTESEARVLERIGLALDVPPTSILELLKRWTLPGAAASTGETAGAPAAEDAKAAERRRWLAVLELPEDARPDRQAVERAARRLLDVYSEQRFAPMAPELKDMAAKRRELTQEALESLLAELPQAPAAGKPDTEMETVRRENPDLDSIFAA